MNPNRVVFSCAHVGEGGARSLDGSLVEAAYSARVVEEAVRAAKADGVLEPWTLSLPNLRRKEGRSVLAKVPAIDALAPACTVEPHLNALRRPDAQDEDDDGDYQELVDDRRGNGFMVLHAAGSVRGRALALSIAAALEAALPKWSGRKGDPFRNRGAEPCPGPMVFRRKVAFLNDTRCVAALPELLFLSNPDERAWLLRPDSPAVLGRALAAGVLAWHRAEAGGAG